MSESASEASHNSKSEREPKGDKEQSKALGKAVPSTALNGPPASDTCNSLCSSQEIETVALNNAPAAPEISLTPVIRPVHRSDPPNELNTTKRLDEASRHFFNTPTASSRDKLTYLYVLERMGKGAADYYAEAFDWQVEWEG